MNEGETLFSLTLPADAIVDVTVSLKFIENEAAEPCTDTPAGATPGTIYYDYLDGIASGKLTPVGPVNILP